ncbi:MAG: alanine racemase [Blastocatellia bacterium]|nr:alanine racemase [Blastocatellia bacterium]MBN8721643.1 alanine racemase [Acidobacteriota bacterium]
MRPTWAEVRLDYIADNYQKIKEFVGSSVKVMAVIKADAYGHGASEVAKYLENQAIKPDWFGVALTEEAVKLRETGVKTPILCLGGFWKSSQASKCIKYNLVPTIYRFDMLENLVEAARQAACSWKFHLKIDTGMGRLGILPDELPTFLEKLKIYPEVILDGVMTHLASADELEKSEFTKKQLTIFEDCLSQIRQAGFNPTYQHTANSAATCSWPQAYGNLVRAGGLLYGLTDTIAPNVKLKVKPALSLHSTIILLKKVAANTSLGYCNTFFTNRESLIATIPIGYEDGLARSYSNIGQVLVHNQLATIVGRVSMDLTLIDVTDIANVALGDRVTLIGQMGGKSISAEKVASTINTISYEITCGLSARVPRIYLTED